MLAKVNQSSLFKCSCFPKKNRFKKLTTRKTEHRCCYAIINKQRTGTASFIWRPYPENDWNTSKYSSSRTSSCTKKLTVTILGSKNTVQKSDMTKESENVCSWKLLHCILCYHCCGALLSYYLHLKIYFAILGYLKHFWLWVGTPLQSWF